MSSLISVAKKASLFAILLPLAACQTAMPISQVKTAVPTNANVVNGDVLQAQRLAGADIPALRGTKLLTVRTHHYIDSEKTKNKKKVEFAGANCSLQSDGFTATVTSPGQVRIPDYGYASRLVSVKCDAKGHKTGFMSVAAYDATKSARSSAGAGNGLIGLVAMELINAADSEKNNKFEYRVANVLMNQIGCETTKSGCKSR